MKRVRGFMGRGLVRVVVGERPKWACSPQGGAAPPSRKRASSNSMKMKRSICGRRIEIPRDLSWALYTRHRAREVRCARSFHQRVRGFFAIVCRRSGDGRTEARALALPLFPCYVFVRGGLHRQAPDRDDAWSSHHSLHGRAESQTIPNGGRIQFGRRLTVHRGRAGVLSPLR